MTRRTLARIAQMDRGELAWRVEAAARVAVDRVRATVREPDWNRGALARALAPQAALNDARTRLASRRWDEAQQELACHFARRPPRFVIAGSLRPAIVQRIQTRFASAAGDASARGDQLLRGEFDLLGYRGLRFDADGSLVDWHLDPVHNRRPPRGFWSSVPYLDPASGDHKIIWELNRHQHWLALGRAYWLTGRRDYRQRALLELGSWLDANPPLVGVNWASMLELGLRSISWLWALELFADASCDDDPPWIVDLLVGIERQLVQVERNLSYYFSPNTHLLGEALALYVAGRALPELSASERWATVGRRVLAAETARQILHDGGHCERSTHYHRYALDFYLLALAVARITRDPIAALFERAVGRLAGAARILADESGRLPHIGDDDGGLLLPIAGRAADDLRDSLAIAAALVDRTELRIGPIPEEACWMLSHPALRERLEILASSAPGGAVSSAALPEMGYYVSRSERGDHLVVDGGAHGYQNGGHAHSDALSLTLSINNTPLLIDSGTATYTVNAALRDRFRATDSHNTLTLDGQPQSIPASPFHWLRTADSRVHRWRMTRGFDYFDGCHNGYASLDTEHRRRVLMLHGELLVVADLVDGRGTHRAAVHWHVSPEWTINLGNRSATLTTAADSARFFTTCGNIERFSGDELTGLGWLSPAYGTLEPATTLRIVNEAAAPFWMISVFDLDPLDPVTIVETMPLWAVAGSMAHGAGIRIVRAGSADYVLFAEPSRAGARLSWRAGEFETDARVLLCRVAQRGELTRVALVDGSFVRDSGRRGLRLALGETVRALYLDELGMKAYTPCAASRGL